MKDLRKSGMLDQPRRVRTRVEIPRRAPSGGALGAVADGPDEPRSGFRSVQICVICGVPPFPSDAHQPSRADELRLPAGVGAGDDLAHTLLVEPLVAVVALEVLQVRAD